MAAVRDDRDPDGVVPGAPPPEPCEQPVAESDSRHHEREPEDEREQLVPLGRVPAGPRRCGAEQPARPAAPARAARSRRGDASPGSGQPGLCEIVGLASCGARRPSSSAVRYASRRSSRFWVALACSSSGSLIPLASALSSACRPPPARPACRGRRSRAATCRGRRRRSSGTPRRRRSAGRRRGRRREASRPWWSGRPRRPASCSFRPPSVSFSASAPRPARSRAPRRCGAACRSAAVARRTRAARSPTASSPVNSASSFWESPSAFRCSATCSAMRAKNQPWSASTWASRSRSRSKASGVISHVCYNSKHEIRRSSRLAARYHGRRSYDAAVALKWIRWSLPGEDAPYRGSTADGSHRPGGSSLVILDAAWRLEGIVRRRSRRSRCALVIASCPLRSSPSAMRRYSMAHVLADLGLRRRGLGPGRLATRPPVGFVVRQPVLALHRHVLGVGHWRFCDARLRSLLARADFADCSSCQRARRRLPRCSPWLSLSLDGSASMVRCAARRHDDQLVLFVAGFTLSSGCSYLRADERYRAAC